MLLVSVSLSYISKKFGIILVGIWFNYLVWQVLFLRLGWTANFLKPLGEVPSLGGQQ